MQFGLDFYKKLQKLNANSLKWLGQSLQILNLSSNKINEINPNTFQSLQNMQRLAMKENQLRQIDPKWFISLSNLQLLH